MIKRIVKILGILVLVLFLLAGAYFLFMQRELSKMTPADTGKITDTVYAIRDSYVNSFLVKGENGYIMIDEGKKPSSIHEGLLKLNIRPEQVIAVFLTHSDADHVAGLPLFPNTPVYISRDEEQMFNGKTPRFFIFGNHLASSNYKLLEDGQEISISGLTVKGILTPGHTPGSMCYLVNGKYLFTGDVLKLKDGKVEQFNRYISMDAEKDRESIIKLSRLENVGYIFTAHYGFTNNVEEAFKDWRESR